MKRELKVRDLRIGPPEDAGIARPIPMKRELKVEAYRIKRRFRKLIARPIPMKRELKGYMLGAFQPQTPMIARPIPMKRELKDLRRSDRHDGCREDRKAHPDEKGTESVKSAAHCNGIGGISQGPSR